MNDTILHLGLIDDADIQLDGAALELAALDHPGVDLGVPVALLSDLTERLVDVGGDARTSVERAEALAAVIAGDYGFAGDRETYDDPANADLIRVISRRRGLPVSLSILYVAAARRLNWTADALNTPGHVLVRIGADVAPVLVDPFRDGRIVGADALRAIVSAADGAGAEIRPGHLAPMSNRETLTRLLLNQATRAEGAGQTLRALGLYERMTIIAPANVHAWWQRARLQLAVHDIAAARASLSAMLEMTREPTLRARVTETLARLAETGD